MTTESTNFALPVNNDQQSVDVQLSGGTSGDFRSSCEITFPVISDTDNIYYFNEVEVNSEIQHSRQSECVSVCGFQKGSDQMKKGSCSDNKEERNQLHLGIQVSEKEINGIVVNQLSVKSNDPRDLLTEDEPSQENYRLVKSNTLHEDNNCEDILSGCAEDKKRPSDSCIKQLGKATSESQSCRSSTNLPVSLNLSMGDGLLPKDHQHIKNTLPDVGDKIKTDLCGCGTVEALLPLSVFSDRNKDVSGETESQPADSISSLADENILPREFEHHQRLLLETGDNIENTLYKRDRVEASIPWRFNSNKETSQQSKNQHRGEPVSSLLSEDLMKRHGDPIKSPVNGDFIQSQCHCDPVSSSVNEDLIPKKCQHILKALPCADDKIKIDLCQRDKVAIPSPCKKDSQLPSCVHDPADSCHPTADEELSQEECQHFKYTMLHAGGNIKIPLCTCDKIPVPCNSNCNTGDNEKDYSNCNKGGNEKMYSNCNKGGNGKIYSNCNKGGNENIYSDCEKGDNEKNDSNCTKGGSEKSGSYCTKGGNEKKYSNCEKGDNENKSVNPYDPCNISLEEDRIQNDYHSVKMQLLELKQKFDKAVCNINTDKHLPSLTSAHADEDIKLTQEDTSLAKTDDPFDLSSEDDLYPEKYRPLKRKLCTDSKECSNNNNPDSELARVVGAAEADSQAKAVLLKAPENKRQKTACRVAYVHSQQLLEKANELIRIKGRAELVHSLIASFGLLQYLQVVNPRYATHTEILGFHCPDYISFLRDSGDVPDGDDHHDCHAESYGLSYDCPIQNGIYETCALISGATITAAETLINNAADVVINWYGGWHHAKRDTAAGFCYINDIVLGILKLREKFDRILYVDIDLHHGDGVEEAFSMTPKVMTVSFHKYMFGFFPGTGEVTDIGTGKGKYYSVNVPLLDGIKDAEFCAMFYSIMKLVREKFQPQVIVLQCGADTLSSDPMTSFNLTHLGISRCVGLMLSWNLPTMLLGGGGYNFPNTAKCWTFLTSLAASRKLPLDIPEHEHLLAYGPDFEMSTTAGYRKDCNTKQHLANLVADISRNLSSI